MTGESARAVVHLLSGGAAQGLMDALHDDVAALGIDLQASFGAVGAMQERLLAGAPCDVFISTMGMLRSLAGSGVVAGDSIAALGRVATGIAVKASGAVPAISDANALRAALRGAAEIHCPDTVLSTAGIHFAKVLQQLGMAHEVAARLHTHPNGMTAMRALAVSGEARAIGCTQITEILATPGLRYAGDLPGELALGTVYGAALTTAALSEPVAAALLQSVAGAGAAARALRQRCGFADS